MLSRKPYVKPERRPMVPIPAALRSNARMMTATDVRPEKAPTAIPKTAPRVVQSIRDSARGEECTVRIVGVCSHDPAKTIWSHAPMQAAGKGRGIKSLDVAGAYCCTACDAVIDRQAALPSGVSYDRAMLDWYAGHMRSLVILSRKGLL